MHYGDFSSGMSWSYVHMSRVSVHAHLKTLFSPSDEAWLLAPSGCLQVEEVLQKLPDDSPSCNTHPSSLPWLHHPSDLLAASPCRVDTSGLHQGHDSQTPLPEAQGRGKLLLHLLLLLILLLRARERGLLVLRADRWGVIKKFQVCFS